MQTCFINRKPFFFVWILFKKFIFLTPEFVLFADAGRGQVEVIILDPKGNRNTVPCRVRKTDDNVYRCEYVAQVNGMHSVNVFFAGQQIPKSPFGVKVTPGKALDFLILGNFSSGFIARFLFLSIENLIICLGEITIMMLLSEISNIYDREVESMNFFPFSL